MLEPRFNLIKIPLFMSELGRHDWAVPKIRTLELWSTDKGRAQEQNRLPFRFPMLEEHPGNFPVMYPAVRHPPHSSVTPDQKRYIDTIKRFSKNHLHE